MEDESMSQGRDSRMVAGKELMATENSPARGLDRPSRCILFLPKKHRVTDEVDAVPVPSHNYFAEEKKYHYSTSARTQASARSQESFDWFSPNLREDGDRVCAYYGAVTAGK
jgi:hypothetical protein